MVIGYSKLYFIFIPLGFSRRGSDLVKWETSSFFIFLKNKQTQKASIEF